MAMIEFNSECEATVPVMKVSQPSAADDRIETIKLEKRNRTEELNFAYSFRPIYYYSRIFGLMPFTIMYDSNGDPQEPRVGLFNFVWFIAAIGLYTSMAYFSYIDMNVPRDASIPYAILISGFSLQISRLIFGALAIGMDMWNRFKIVDILKKLNIFNKEAIPSFLFKYIRLFKQ